MGEHHDVGEDPALRIGEEAVGALARREALDVAGHVGVQEALAVRAEDLQPSHPGAVGEPAALAQSANLVHDGTVAGGHEDSFLRREDRPQTFVEPGERQWTGGGEGSGRHRLSLQSSAMTETVAFALQTGSTALHGIADLPDLPGERPAVVICHGFKGFMEWGFFPHLAALLAERGFVAVRFNLSGAGMRPGDELVTDLDAFRENTYSRELADLLAVLGALGEEVAPGRVDRRRLGLFGHSRGGGDALLAAARPPWCERLRALVTWAAIADVDRFTPEQKADWRREGELPVVNARTGQRLALGVGLLDDVEQRRPELDLLAAAAARGAPWLIVHGADDESVPAAEAHRLAARAGGGKELLAIPGANHTFGVRHPFAGPTPQLVQALNATQRWFRTHL